MAKSSDEYSKKEAAERFAAALRGARIAGHKSMSDVKRGIGRSKQRKQTKTKVKPGK